jgi:hypothetical protein
VRSQDPFLHVANGWLARRIAPDCVKLDLAAPEGRDAELRLLRRMGAETANIHLAGRELVAPVRDDLNRCKRRWLQDAVGRLADATRDDHRAWCKKSERSGRG